MISNQKQYLPDQINHFCEIGLWCRDVLHQCKHPEGQSLLFIVYMVSDHHSNKTCAVSGAHPRPPSDLSIHNQRLRKKKEHSNCTDHGRGQCFHFSGSVHRSWGREGKQTRAWKINNSRERMHVNKVSPRVVANAAFALTVLIVRTWTEGENRPAILCEWYIRAMLG